jgi:hypothetical protein
MPTAGNEAGFAGNAFGVNVQDLDYTVADAPTTKTYHGCAIVANGNVIGRVQTWSLAGARAREATHVYELNSSTWGKPVDIVPGRSTGYTISMARVELWNAELERALGYGAVFSDLTDQNRPFTLLEYLYRGSMLYRAWQYLGCWFTNLNEQEFGAEGDAKVSVQCDILYVTRKRIDS